MSKSLKEWLPFSLVVLLLGIMAYHTIFDGRYARSLEKANVALQKTEAAARADSQAARDELALKMAAADREIAEIRAREAQAVTAANAHKQAAAEAKAEADALRAEVQPLIDANPALKAYVSKLEFRLAEQDAAIFSLEQAAREKDAQISTLNTRVALADASAAEWRKTAESWERQYRAEHALRLDQKSMSRAEVWAWRAVGAAGWVWAAVKR